MKVWIVTAEAILSDTGIGEMMEWNQCCGAFSSEQKAIDQVELLAAKGLREKDQFCIEEFEIDAELQDL